MKSRKIKIRHPSLDDIAFEGRNKSYGAYYLRKHYHRYLVFSKVVSLIIFLLMFLVPFYIYYFEGADTQLEPWTMEIVDVYPMPPPENENDVMAKTMIRPPQENTPPPVVQDSVKEPEKAEEVKPPDEEKTDTAGKDSHSQAGKGEGTGDNSTIYTVIDVYPRFPGGDQARLYYLRTHIHYPDAALKKGIQGVVVVVFVIEPDGTISNVEIANGIGWGCDDEALRVTRGMPSWEPGKRNGRAVRVMVRMPIVFRIPGRS